MRMLQFVYKLFREEVTEQDTVWSVAKLFHIISTNIL